ncbi:MAG TPA: site-specific integrase [Actinomycetota bacterium]|nr:site-specific integrase [Actinomycetota bacterium]
MAFIERVTGPRRGVRYRIRYRDPSGRHRSETFRRRKDAEDRLHQLEVALRGGTWRDPRASRTPLAERARAWLAGRHDLRPSTARIYEGVLRRHVLPALGDRPIGSLRPEDVRAFVSGLLERGVGRRTAQLARQVLGSVLEEAVRDGVIPSNPVRHAPAPRAERRELRLISPEELEGLLEVVPERWRPLVLVAAWCGLRWGEIAGLRVEDVDPLRRRIHVRRQAVEAGGKLEVTDVKTAAGRRVVAMPPSVAEAVAAAIGDRREGFVFPSAAGGPLGRRAWMSRVWRPAVRAAGLEGLRFHDLRHFAASVAVAAGAHPRALQARLGHSTSRVTLDVYASVLPGLDEEIAERLEAVREQARRRALDGGRVLPLRRD